MYHRPVPKPMCIIRHKKVSHKVEVAHSGQVLAGLGKAMRVRVRQGEQNILRFRTKVANRPEKLRRGLWNCRALSRLLQYSVRQFDFPYDEETAHRSS